MIRKEEPNDRCRPTIPVSCVRRKRHSFSLPSPEWSAPNRTISRSWWRRRQPGQRMTLTNVIRRRRIRLTLQQVIIYNLLNTHTKARLLCGCEQVESVQWKLHNTRIREPLNIWAQNKCVWVFFTPSSISMWNSMLANGLSHILILSQRWSVKLCKRVIVVYEIPLSLPNQID